MLKDWYQYSDYGNDNFLFQLVNINKNLFIISGDRLALIQLLTDIVMAIV